MHIGQVRELTQRLREAGRAFGSDPDVSTAATTWAERLLAVPGAEPLTRALVVALSELHIHAGWSAFDAGLYNRMMSHYGRALRLATDAADSYCQALALNWAGMATVERGHPDHGLKLLQLGLVSAWRIPADDQRAVTIGPSTRAALEACTKADAASAYAALGDHQAAERELATARELWHPGPNDPYGNIDRPAACIELDRGRLDVAEQLATASVRRGLSDRSRTRSRIVLATVHVRAGEPDGPRLAHDVITAVRKLSSVRARQQLEPLAEALDTRPGTEARDLARTARQVVATRA